MFDGGSPAYFRDVQPISLDVLDGSCLCGVIGFELGHPHPSATERETGVCACSSCQHWSGSAELPYLVVIPENFRITRGEMYLAHYRDDESRLRTFCRRCGSCLYYDAGRTYHVVVGVVDLASRAESV
jgi:hypothetical protein